MNKFKKTLCIVCLLICVCAFAVGGYLVTRSAMNECKIGSNQYIFVEFNRNIHSKMVATQKNLEKSITPLQNNPQIILADMELCRQYLTHELDACIFAYADFDDDNMNEVCVKNDFDADYGLLMEETEEALYMHYTEAVAHENVVWWKVAQLDEGECEELQGVVWKNEEGTRIWNPKEEDFVQMHGFEAEEPFYEYFDEEGEKLFTIYYDPNTGNGCGISYYLGRGFVFSETEGVRWEDIRKDYFTIETIRGETCPEEVSDYEENVEYDNEGRMIHYESFGVWEKGSGVEREFILRLLYEYDSNGSLLKREYSHNSSLFGTWCSYIYSRFDEAGRVEYESAYITHGSLEYLYIYQNDSAKASYALEIDCNMGTLIPRFVKVQ